MNQTQALLLTATPLADCRRQLHAGNRVGFFLKSQHASGPGVPSLPHAITLPAISMTILSARTILSRASYTHGTGGGRNKGAIAGVAIGIIAAVVIAALAIFYLRRRGRRAPSARFIIDPVSNGAGAPRVFNTQPEPNKEVMKGPSDGGALDLSTMPVLPTTPMKVYVRIFMPSLRSRLFILFLGSLGSE